MCALLQDSQNAPSFSVGPEDEVIFTDLSDIYRLKESNFLSDNGDIDEGHQEHQRLPTSFYNQREERVSV